MGYWSIAVDNINQLRTKSLTEGVCSIAMVIRLLNKSARNNQALIFQSFLLLSTLQSDTVTVSEKILIIK